MNHIDQKVEDVSLLDGFPHVLFLQGTPLVQLRIIPGADAQVQDEQFASLGKEHWSFGRNHADVFVRLHDALDAGQWQVVVVLEIVFRLVLERLDFRVGRLPELIQGRVHLSQELRRTAGWWWRGD